MRTVLSILMLVCLASVTIQQQSQNQRVLSQLGLALPPPSVILSRLVQHGVDKLEGLQKQFSGADVNLFSDRKSGLGIGTLFKPLLLVALAKIKLALLFGNPLVLLVLKKLLLHAVLGKLLLKIPLILLGGKALLLTNIMAIKFALIAKGLIGFKASLTLLFLGGFLKNTLGGSGLTTILGLAGSLLKLTGHGFKSEEDDEQPNFKLPVTTFGIPPSFAKPSFNSPPVPLKTATSYQSRATVLSTPATPLTAPISTNLNGTNFGLGISGFGANGFSGSGLLTIRAKRDVQGDNGERRGEFSGESLEDLKLEFEAARTNGNAYLFMAAQFDEQSCGLRLLCEVYRKPQESLTQDEILLQNLLG